MILPNATITAYATREGTRGDGRPALRDAGLSQTTGPLPCSVGAPTWKQEQSAQQTGVRAERAVRIERETLRAASIEPKVGDRLTLTLDYAPGDTSLLEVTMLDGANFATDAEGGLAGAIDAVALVCAEANDSADIAPYIPPGGGD